VPVEKGIEQVVGYVIAGLGGISGIALLRHFLIRGIDSIVENYKREGEQRFNDACKLVEFKFEHNGNELRSIRDDLRDLYLRTNSISPMQTEIAMIKEDISEIKADCKEYHKRGER
jgi:hypothetical protein